MRLTFLLAILAFAAAKQFKKKQELSIFRDEQVIFSSHHNITKLFVPADGNKNLLADTSEIPSIFFTMQLESDSCIYVLEGFAAFEVLDGGRDSTASYHSDRTVYFGAKDGLYKYNRDTLSAKKFGPFRDDIIQLQKSNLSDTIYILTADYKLYRIQKNGTVRNRVVTITCASQFVLDMSDNIYYIGCDDHAPYMIKATGQFVSFAAVIVDNYKDVRLLRPAFIMEKCVPFFGDGDLYILYANGTSEKKDFQLKGKPSAFSLDASLYIVVAMNGKIYEYNVMEVLLRSMFSRATEWPTDISRIVMSIIDTAKDGVYKDLNNIL